MAELVSMPKLGFDMAEGILVRWVIPEGQSVQKGDVLAEIETDKATVEVESSHSGVVVRHLVVEGTSVPVGEAIAVIGAEGEEVDVESLVGSAVSGEFPAPGEGIVVPSGEAAPLPEEAAIPGEGQLPAGVRASPLARKMARDQGVDLGSISGTGPLGRIVRRDVEAFLTATPGLEFPAPRQAPPLVSPSLEDVRVPLSRLRQAIGRRMTEAWQQVPHFFVTYAYDLEPLLGLRKQVNALLEEGGEKVSVNDFLLKAVALCLREFPNLNASLGEGEVLRHGHVNVGVAVAVENGLLTVAHKDTDLKSVRQISTEIQEMVTRARVGKVRPDDVSGSTFTVSNLGMYGVEEFVAIINPPEAAILAVGGGKQVPVVENGEVTIGVRMKATLSVDHRVSDGAEAARFMQALAKYIQEPLRLMV